MPQLEVPGKDFECILGCVAMFQKYSLLTFRPHLGQATSEVVRHGETRSISTMPPPPTRPGLFLLVLVLLPCLSLANAAETPGCKIRITAKGLELVKQEGLRFVEQELENITIPDLHGKEGQFHYNISNVRVTHLDLPFSDLRFQTKQHLAFDIRNASIALRFRRQILYWFFYDIGSINASAEGVHIHTALELSKDSSGRLKISNSSCSASIARMNAGFSGTLRRVYQFLSTFITTGMRFLLNQQICPVLNHAGLVLLNSVLDTVPVRNPVDDHIGIDYSLLDDPVVTASTMDLAFKVPKDLEVLLRASFFGSIVMMNPEVMDAPLLLRLQATSAPRCSIQVSGMSVSVTALFDIFLAPPEQPLVQLSSMTMEARMSARVALRQKALQVQLDLRRFRIYSNQSALESLALIPLQGPLKTLLQLAIMPLINEKTKKGVQIPLPEGMDFMKEVITNHMGYLTIGADLHFSEGLREVIEKYRTPA
ncbi:phospholipid transfer protein isoform X3 [Anolis carolinensis]|uniref:phospholipid transfer protein isoform X3 n=1 Tax=Anolis carolinensis TaxID=28377 RepID=UPI002F2B5A57